MPLADEELQKIIIELNISSEDLGSYSCDDLKEALDKEMKPQEIPGLNCRTFILNALYEEELVNSCYPAFVVGEASDYFSKLADNLSNWENNFASQTTKWAILGAIQALGMPTIGIGISSLFLTIDLLEINVAITKLAEVISNRALFYYLFNRSQGDSHETAWGEGIPLFWSSEKKQATENFFKSLWNKYGEAILSDNLAGFKVKQHNMLRELILQALSQPPIATPENAISTLLANLEYPTGLWIKGDRIYLTETAGHNTTYGGKTCLDQYDVTTAQKSVLVNNPKSFDAVVVASDDNIYLTSYQYIILGESGTVSVVNPETNIETHILDINIASEDMFIDSNDDILIIGSSDRDYAKSIYLLPAEDYTNPIVVKTGLGRTWCISKSGPYTYFSDQSAIRRFSNSGPIETFVNKSVMSMSFSSEYLFYADYFSGTIGLINLTTRSDETIISGLHGPHTVRYDELNKKLYFLESGSSSAQFKDGTLKVIKY